MALSITTPAVPTPASGQQNVEPYNQKEVGQPFDDFTGGSTTAAGQIKITIAAPDDGPSVSVWVTAASSLYTTAGKFQYIPEAEGLYQITVLDVTAGVSLTTTVEVFNAPGA